MKRTRGKKWMQIRTRILERDPLCVLCLKEGRTRPSVEVDHYPIPLHLGGSDSDDNLRGICREHHRRVTAEQMGYRVTYGCDANGWPLGNHPWNAGGKVAPRGTSRETSRQPGKTISSQVKNGS